MPKARHREIPDQAENPEDVGKSTVRNKAKNTLKKHQKKFTYFVTLSRVESLY